MANAVGDRVWRPSAPDRIDADLTALWREIARDGPVSRAVMSNLVVYCRCPADRDIDLASPPAGIPIEGVASHHPARVILLHHDPDAPGAQLPLAAQRRRPDLWPTRSALRRRANRHPVRLQRGRAALNRPPADARRRAHVRLVDGGFLGDASAGAARDDGTAARLRQPALARRPSGRTCADAAADGRVAPCTSASAARPDLADVNWRRLTPVRQALVHAIGSGGDRETFGVGLRSDSPSHG